MTIAKVFTEEEIQNIIKEYQEGVSCCALARKFRVRDGRIKQIIIDNGIYFRKKGQQFNKENYKTTNKYSWDDDYFEEINTEDKAYWLGFLYADGNVYIPKSKSTGNSKGGRVEITLKEEDSYHLYNFVNCMNGNMPIKNKTVKLNGKKYPACRVTINSIKMANNLIKHGCVEAKSLILKFPSNLDKELLPHFIRGYIDGDGCVGFYTYEFTDKFSVSLLGTVNFLEGIKETLEYNKIKCSDVKPEKSNAYILHINGRENLGRLYDYLYSDAHIFLGRKIDKFREALIYFNIDFNINPTAKLFALFDNDLNDKLFHKNVMRPIRREEQRIGM